MRFLIKDVLQLEDCWHQRILFLTTSLSALQLLRTGDTCSHVLRLLSELEHHIKFIHREALDKVLGLLTYAVFVSTLPLLHL